MALIEQVAAKLDTSADRIYKAMSSVTATARFAMYSTRKP